MLWRASDYKLTLTGSYLQDRQDVPNWWHDVYIVNAIYQEEEDEVRELFAAADEMLRRLQSSGEGRMQ